jgi:sigma-B regulation protein RsbU (phosphoserine phosphatase)
MTDLGSMLVDDLAGASRLRRKILALGGLLDQPRLWSTRLATAVHELVESIRSQGGSVKVQVAVVSDGSLRGLRFGVQGDAAELARPAPLFFDSWQRDGDTVHAVRAFHAPPELGPEGLQAAEALVREKDRSELMREVHERNAELQESLDRLRRTTFAKDRMESELNIGRDIQMSMLPLEFPPFPERDEFSIYARLVPAREVGGDFYDFFFVDRDRLVVCVGDVSGKGVPSALFAAVTKTLIKSVSKSDPSVASIVTQVNDEIAQNNESCMFVTLLVAMLDVTTGQLCYCNAGHNPPFIRSASGGIHALRDKHGPVAGAVEELAYRQSEATLGPGDMLVLYTDGVTEATNVHRELYSEDRLAALLREGPPGDAPETTVNRILEAVNDFEEGAEQADDVTILAVAMRQTGTDEAQRRLRIRLEPELSEIARLNSEFKTFADLHGLQATLVQRLSIAFDELINNIVSYGYRGAEDPEPIEVEMDLRHGHLVISVRDSGIPFNPFVQVSPDTTLSMEEREIGGLGIHMVKQLMDEVAYTRRGPHNVVTLKKSLHDQGATPAPRPGSPTT